MKSVNLFSQELEVGEHIYKDKLTYITLFENNKFNYNKYYKWSPLTIEEERKNEERGSRMCGSIGYASGAKGKGKYKFKEGKLILKFDEFQKYMDSISDFNPETKSMEFIISDFIN